MSRVMLHSRHFSRSPSVAQMSMILGFSLVLIISCRHVASTCLKRLPFVGNWRMMSSRSVGRRRAVSSRAERHLCVDLGGLLLPIEPRASSRQSRSLGLGGSFSSCWRLGRSRVLESSSLSQNGYGVPNHQPVSIG